MKPIDNRDPLVQLIDLLVAFALRSFAALAETDVPDTVNGVVSVLVDTDPLKLAVLVDDALVATQLGDESLAVLVRAVVARGLATLPPKRQQSTGAKIAGRQAVIVLRHVLGQDVAVVTANVVGRDDFTAQEALFVLPSAPREEIVH
jgi:hypothetical protein